MSEPKRIPCLSDGAVQALRDDLADAKKGEPIVVAWNYVSKALDEIEWLRNREAKLESKLRDAEYELAQQAIVLEDVTGRADAADARAAELTDKTIAYDLDQAGIERRTAEAVELVDLRARVVELEGQLEDSKKWWTARVAKLYVESERHIDRVSELEKQVKTQ